MKRMIITVIVLMALTTTVAQAVEPTVISEAGTIDYTSGGLKFTDETPLDSAESADFVNGVAEVEAMPDSLTFYPHVSFAQLELTIVGNDNYWQKRYGQSEAATFSVFDEILTDGQYRFELIVSPPYDEEAWELARDDPDLRHELEVLERAETYRQTGRFEVAQGRITLITDPHASPGAGSNK